MGRWPNPSNLFAFTICSVVILLLLGALGPTTAQEPDEVLRVTTDLLLFPVRIRDHHGQAISGLTTRELSLKDRDHVTSDLYLTQGVDRLALLFALDQSGSVRQTISQQRDAAVALFERFGDKSTVAVMRFAERPSLISPFAREHAATRTAFDVAAIPNHRTAIFDAAKAAVQTFDQLPRVRSERHIVILISDGLDNASLTQPEAVVEMARAKRVSFYIVHLPLLEPRDGRLAIRTPSKGFRELGEKTGGKYFLVGDAKAPLTARNHVDLSKVFDEIENDLRSQYLLGFYLNETANDGAKHKWELTVPDGVEFQIIGSGYSRTHQFFVERPRPAPSR
jgi:VWFA-related protein